VSRGAASRGIRSGLSGEWPDMVLSIVISPYGAATSVIKAF
jgi:hypothetical protein